MVGLALRRDIPSSHSLPFSLSPRLPSPCPVPRPPPTGTPPAAGSSFLALAASLRGATNTTAASPAARALALPGSDGDSDVDSEGTGAASSADEGNASECGAASDRGAGGSAGGNVGAEGAGEPPMPRAESSGLAADEDLCGFLACRTRPILLGFTHPLAVSPPSRRRASATARAAADDAEVALILGSDAESVRSSEATSNAGDREGDSAEATERRHTGGPATSLTKQAPSKAAPVDGATSPAEAAQAAAAEAALTDRTALAEAQVTLRRVEYLLHGAYVSQLAQPEFCPLDSSGHALAHTGFCKTIKTALLSPITTPHPPLFPPPGCRRARRQLMRPSRARDANAPPCVTNSTRRGRRAKRRVRAWRSARASLRGRALSSLTSLPRRTRSVPARCTACWPSEHNFFRERELMRKGRLRSVDDRLEMLASPGGAAELG